jgi:hypothetical protein
MLHQEEVAFCFADGELAFSAQLLVVAVTAQHRVTA